MAFFTGWLGKIGGADGGATLIGDLLRMRGIVLATAADAIDIWRSNGAGAALVSVADAALPTGAASEASLATLCPCTLSPSADGTITKSDATVYDPPLRALWATGAGNLVVMLSGDTASVMTIPVTAGEKITWVSARKVMAATTATGISGAR